MTGHRRKREATSNRRMEGNRITDRGCSLLERGRRKTGTARSNRGRIGSSARTRNWNPSVSGRQKLGYLIDSAARLATYRYLKARKKHSSGTAWVLVSCI